MKTTPQKLLLFFDGSCPLCHWSIAFLQARDQHKRFIFYPLQSPKAAHFFPQNQPPQLEKGVVLLIDQQYHYRSEAIIKALQHLPFPYSLAGALRILPRKIRDTLYNWVARNRYWLFPTQHNCPLPISKNRQKQEDDLPIQ